MSNIILDCGFGAQCHNDPETIKQMIFSIKEIDSGEHRIIFKWQLFKKETIPVLEPLSHDMFALAFHTAKKLGYATTSSVFDEESLKFLEMFDVPWVKIAARPGLHKDLLPLVTKNVVVSVDGFIYPEHKNVVCFLHCIAKYPVEVSEYENKYSDPELKHSISDHTIGLELFKKYKPTWWEKHYLLKREPIDDPFGNDWYTTPEELKEIL